MPLLPLLYHGAKSQKWPKTEIKGGPDGFVGAGVVHSHGRKSKRDAFLICLERKKH